MPSSEITEQTAVSEHTGEGARQLSQSCHASVLRLRALINRCSRCPSVGTLTTKLPSYLVDVLRYTVHFLGPGHPCWCVSQNHRLKIPFRVLFFLFHELWRWFVDPVCGDWETSSSDRGISAFIGKSSTAPTPAWLPTQPLRQCLSVEAQRRTQERGGAAFTEQLRSCRCWRRGGT